MFLWGLVLTLLSDLTLFDPLRALLWEQGKPLALQLGAFLPSQAMLAACMFC